MGLWILVILWVLLTNYVLKYGESEVKTINNHYEKIQYSRAYTIILFFVPFIVVASRINYVDTGGYMETFSHLSNEFNSLSSKNETGYELFRFFQIFIKRYITSDPQSYLFIIALIQSVLLIVTLRKYSCNLFHSVFLFISSGMMLSWMCNGMRQFLAAVILFAFTSLLVKKKWYIYFFVAVILMGVSPICKFFGIIEIPWVLGGIHQSVFIVILALPFLYGKPLNARIWILTIAVVVIAISGQFDSVISMFSSNTSYVNDLQYVRQDTGMNPIRFLVSLVPVVMVLIRKHAVLNEDTPQIIKLCINMSVVSSAMYFAGVFTSGIFVGRLPIYFELYNLILIPWIIENIYSDHKRIIVPCFFVLYIAYYIYQLIAWNASSYVINLFGIKICF